jgi:integrase
MGRRATGSVEARETCIRLKFTHLGKRQVEKLELRPSPANVRAAEKMMARIQGAIDAGVYRREDFFDSPGKAGGRQTFAEYADAWLETLTVAKSTKRLYKTALKMTWKPAFGDVALVQVRHSDIQRAIAQRSQVVSPGNLNSHITVVRSVFETAVADELIPRSPAARIKNLKRQKSAPDPFTPKERDAILERMREKYDEQIWNYYTLAFFTGLRPSEQIALLWGDVDWKRKKLRVRRAVVEREEKTTKSAREREIDLNEPAMAALVRQKARTFLKGPTGPIFHNPNTGRAWRDEALQRLNYFIPTLVALKIRHRDAYQTRHTYATTLMMGGLNPKWISRQLGHASLQMLFEVYGAWLEDADGGAQAAKADAVMRGDNVPELSPKPGQQLKLL